MAGNKDLVYSFRINTDEAKGKIPEIAGEAKTSLDGLGDVASKSADELTQAMKRAEDAVRKLADPNLTPRQLETGIRTATQATERLRDAMAAAQKTGGPVPPDAAAKVKALGDATAKAATESAKLRDVLGDQRARSDQAAKGAEALSSSMGSVEGVLGQLKNQTGATSQAIGEMGFKIVAAAAALKLGFDAATKAREVYQELTGRELPSLTNWVVKLATGVDNATGAYERHGVVARSAIGIHNAHAQTISVLTAKIATMVPEWNKTAEALRTSTEFSKTLDLLLKELAADHQDIAKFAKEHADSIIATLAPALKAGTISVAAMTVEMRLAVRAALDASTAHQQEAKSIADATAKINERVAAEEKAIAAKLLSAEKEVAAAGVSISAIYKHRDELIKALKAEEISTEEFNKRKAEINKKASDDVDAATERETEALGKVEEAHEDYRASQEKARKALADATTAAGEQAKAYDQVRDAMANVNEAFDGVKSGSSSTATEIGKAGEAIQSLGPIADLAKGRLAALRGELDEMTKAAKRAQDAFAGSKT